jgi:hypothetical protein
VRRLERHIGKYFLLQKHAFRRKAALCAKQSRKISVLLQETSGNLLIFDAFSVSGMRPYPDTGVRPRTPLGLKAMTAQSFALCALADQLHISE